MQGLETIPLKMAVMCSVLLIVVGTGTYQVCAFLELRAEQEFMADLVAFSQATMLLRDAGDYGAVTSAIISIPSGYGAVLDLDLDTLTGMLRDRNYSIGLPANLTGARLDKDVHRNGTVLMPGGSEYALRLYYGRLEPGQVKKFTVVFI